jgi:hypothetical protein
MVSQKEIKNRHHFVPQFYLRFFQCSEKQINMCYLPPEGNPHTIKAASLRNQCQKHRFYRSIEIENALAITEGHSARILKRVVSTSGIPPALDQNRPNLDYLRLLNFVALQLQRTSKTIQKINEFATTLFATMVGEEATNNRAQVEFPHAPIYALNFVERVTGAMIDLKLLLICASGNQTFITSDNPVVLYNQIYEGISSIGSAAPTVRGIQIFLPVSPKHMLVLFDPSVYKVNPRIRILEKVPDSDIEQINILQALNAEHSVYFHDWNLADKVVQLCLKANKWRGIREVVNTTATNASRSSLLFHLYERTPHIGLKLSFLTIRTRIRKMKLNERLDPTFLYRSSDLMNLLEDKYLKMNREII